MGKKHHEEGSALTTSKTLIMAKITAFLKYISRKKECYLFILPALILFFVFSLLPFLWTFKLSFFRWDGLNSPVFVGSKNYLHVFNFRESNIFWGSMLNALWITLSSVILLNLTGLFLAVMVDRGIKRGRTAYTVIYYIPPILSGIVVGLVWKWIFDHDSGLANRLLDILGLNIKPVAWLGSTGTALPSVILVSIWKGIGYPFLLYLAGLQSIPTDIYEAAKIDGAGEIQIFFNMTLPLLVPVATIVTILTVLGGMQAFDLVVAMTNGGPGFATEVPTLRIYKEAFRFGRFGSATSFAMVFGFILLVFSLVQMNISKRIKEKY